MKKILFLLLISVFVFSSCASFEKEIAKIDENARNRLVGRMVYNDENLVLDQSYLSTEDDELLFLVRNAKAESTVFDIKLLCDSSITATAPKKTRKLESGDSDVLRVKIDEVGYGTCRLMIYADTEKYAERMFSVK